jgi:hypothetical protein
MIWTSAGATFTYGPDGARLKKGSSAGPTYYLGPDAELSPDGTWTFYVHPEVGLLDYGAAGTAITAAGQVSLPSGPSVAPTSISCGRRFGLGQASNQAAGWPTYGAP